MSRRVCSALAAGGLCVLLAASCRPRAGGERTPAPEPSTSPVINAGEEEKTVAMSLYFPGEERLFPEVHEVPARPEHTAQARAILEVLLAGPRGEGLVPPLPQGTTVGGVYELVPGELTVDLISPAGPPTSGGSLREMLAAYSVVNSLVLNLDGVERTLILWNDRQQTAFAGHLDTARPLAADTRLIARSP